VFFYPHPPTPLKESPHVQKVNVYLLEGSPFSPAVFDLPGGRSDLVGVVRHHGILGPILPFLVIFDLGVDFGLGDDKVSGTGGLSLFLLLLVKRLVIFVLLVVVIVQVLAFRLLLFFPGVVLA